MAYFTDTTNAPKIRSDNQYRTEYLTVQIGGSNITYSASVTTYNYRWVGLTYDAADSIAKAKKSSRVNARAVRMNDAGMYAVEISQDSWGAWSI